MQGVVLAVVRGCRWYWQWRGVSCGGVTHDTVAAVRVVHNHRMDAQQVAARVVLRHAFLYKSVQQKKWRVS